MHWQHPNAVECRTTSSVFVARKATEENWIKKAILGFSVLLHRYATSKLDDPVHPTNLK
jgi:hypothetical protein